MRINIDIEGIDDLKPEDRFQKMMGHYATIFKYVSPNQPCHKTTPKIAVRSWGVLLGYLMPSVWPDDLLSSLHVEWIANEKYRGFMVEWDWADKKYKQPTFYSGEPVDYRYAYDLLKVLSNNKIWK